MEKRKKYIAYGSNLNLGADGKKMPHGQGNRQREKSGIMSCYSEDGSLSAVATVEPKAGSQRSGV